MFFSSVARSVGFDFFVSGAVDRAIPVSEAKAPVSGCRFLLQASGCHGSLAALLKGALALDTGAVCDIGALDFNTGVDIILYVTRLAARVDNHVSFLVQHTTGKHPCVRGMLREVVVDADCLARLQIGSASIRAR